jgi:hypothetical protein
MQVLAPVVDLVYLRVAVTQFLGDKEYLECMPENMGKNWN